MERRDGLWRVSAAIRHALRWRVVDLLGDLGMGLWDEWHCRLRALRLRRAAAAVPVADGPSLGWSPSDGELVGQATRRIIRCDAAAGKLFAHRDRPAFMPAWKKLGNARCDI